MRHEQIIKITDMFFIGSTKGRVVSSFISFKHADSHHTQKFVPVFSAHVTFCWLSRTVSEVKDAVEGRIHIEQFGYFKTFNRHELSPSYICSTMLQTGNNTNNTGFAQTLHLTSTGCSSLLCFV